MQKATRASASRSLARLLSASFIHPAALTGSLHSAVNGLQNQGGSEVSEACVRVFLTEQHFPLSDSLPVSKV